MKEGHVLECAARRAILPAWAGRLLFNLSQSSSRSLVSHPQPSIAAAARQAAGLDADEGLSC